jgi:hypothetical protein
MSCNKLFSITISNYCPSIRFPLIYPSGSILISICSLATSAIEYGSFQVTPKRGQRIGGRQPLYGFAEAADVHAEGLLYQFSAKAICVLT